MSSQVSRRVRGPGVADFGNFLPLRMAVNEFSDKCRDMGH